MAADMHVRKRDGSLEPVDLTKIQRRIQTLAGLTGDAFSRLDVDVAQVSIKTVNGLYNGVTTSELDTLAAETAAAMTTRHPDYGTLAARIAISNLHKNTSQDFVKVTELLFRQVDKFTGEPAPRVSAEYHAAVLRHADAIARTIDYSRDYEYSYFGFKVMERSHLMRVDGRVAESPQQMLMRVSIGIHCVGSFDDIEAALDTYQAMSRREFTHATPTLFNAGTERPQLSSCFLLKMNDDSIEGIYKTLGDCAAISKNAAGIGLSVHNIRAAGSYIKGTGGESNGLVPMLRVFNATACYVDQCFSGDTPVFTRRGPVPARDVRVTDEVLASDGRYHRVLELLRHRYTGEILEIELETGFTARVTPAHRVLARTLVDGAPFTGYMPAGELRPGHRLIMPPTLDAISHDLPHLTEDICRLYGMMLGSRTHLNGLCELEFERSDLEFVKRILPTLGVCDASFYVPEHAHHRRVAVFDPISPHFPFSTRPSSFDAEMLHLPINKLYAVVRGLVSTFQIPTVLTPRIAVPRHLRDAVLFASMRLGDPFALASDEEENRDGSTVVIKVGHHFLGDAWQVPDNVAIPPIPVKSVKRNTTSETVYDFVVQDEPSFTTSIGVAHNGGNKRPGAIAVYLEPWHSDIFEFLDLRNNNGKEEQRARDLFLAMWVPDLFMRRAKENADWSLFSPSEAPGLAEVWGAEFDALYERYEREGRARRTVKARKLLTTICERQINTGNPYMLFKDACNAKSNQRNLGTIQGSNLCAEIVQFTSPEMTAVCNLASLSLPAFVDVQRKTVDFDRLAAAARRAVTNLNRVIDLNYYPTPESERSNRALRPVGLGVQGLADVFFMLRLPFDSKRAEALNREIFETIYFAALDRSCELAERDGPYELYEGSPVSLGELQPDAWGEDLSGSRWDWSGLRERIKRHGVRNSLLTALMPTASTSQILGYNECFEPITSNVYVRRVLSGEFQLVNQYLLRDLIELGLWSEDMRQAIIASNGSIQRIVGIPAEIKELYKTVWEISQRRVLDLARGRAPFVDQTQSMNIHIAHPDVRKMASLHMASWEMGLKTGMYYLRSMPAADAIKFTVDERAAARLLLTSSEAEQGGAAGSGAAGGGSEGAVCSRNNPDCVSCSA